MVFAEQRKTWGLLILTFIWILNGCAYQHPPIQPESVVPPAPTEIKLETPVSEPDGTGIKIPESAESESSVYIHKVCWREETLSHIAKWYTGAIKNWKAIAKANSKLDPKKIDTGDTILIPGELLITRTPMPHSFVGPTDRRKSKSIPSSNKTSISSDSPKLFGPIETQPPSIEPDAAKLFGPIE